jgi:RNA polymerase sigma-70 factor, ECF subfamily
VKADVASLVLSGLHHESDADLLAAAVKRDAKAFGRLVARYHGLVYRVVWHQTKGHAESEDIAQEAFLRLWNNPAQIREAAALKGWLTRVAHNLAMDWFRKRPAQLTEEQGELSDDRPGVERRLQQDWAGARITRAVHGLPDRQRLAVTLVHFEHCSQADAAAVMELSVDAFESLLARARRALKEHLANDRQDLLAALTEEG